MASRVPIPPEFAKATVPAHKDGDAVTWVMPMEFEDLGLTIEIPVRAETAEVAWGEFRRLLVRRLGDYVKRFRP